MCLGLASSFVCGHDVESNNEMARAENRATTSRS